MCVCVQAVALHTLNLLAPIGVYSSVAVKNARVECRLGVHTPVGSKVGVGMLSFDIETEGLNKRKNRITVAAVYDPDKGIERCYNFIKGTSDEIHSEVCGFLEQLDKAEALCSFNGARCAPCCLFNKYAWSWVCLAHALLCIAMPALSLGRGLGRVEVSVDSVGDSHHVIPKFRLCEAAPLLLHPDLHTDAP